MEVNLLRCTENPEELIALAAKKCYASTSTLSDSEYVAARIKQGHESILEHASATFDILGISRTCSHQLVRHRLASYTQRSERYCNEDNRKFIIPDSIVDDNIYIVHDYIILSSKIYDLLIKSGVPKEDARFFLPQAVTTDLVVTMNFRELRHFFKLRLDKHAQWEIRELANRMLNLVKDLAPSVFKEFVKESENE